MKIELLDKFKWKDRTISSNDIAIHFHIESLTNIIDNGPKLNIELLERNNQTIYSSLLPPSPDTIDGISCCALRVELVWI